MAQFCIASELMDKFKGAITSGKIDPDALAAASSSERRAMLEEIVGKENSHQVNSLFESKLLLKDQQRGIVNAVKKLTGISMADKAKLAETAALKAQRLNEYLDPKDMDKFLEDLNQDIVNKKYKIGISSEEAKNITEMSRKITEAESKITESTLDGSAERLNYGAAKVQMQNYIDSLKFKAEKMGLKEYFSAKGLVKGISDLSGLAKATKASFDNSSLFRQNIKTLYSSPGTWLKNSLLSFSDIAKELKGEENVMDGIKAEVYSRKNALNGKYDSLGVQIGMGEEAYPTALPSKIPGLGRFFKASETAYEGVLMRTRADLADHYINIAEKSGVDLTDKTQAKAIGNMINSMTGRGSWGKAEAAGQVVNNVFFSPKMLKGNIDTLTTPLGFDIAGNKVTKFQRKESAKVLLKTIMATAGVLGIAKAMNPDSVELDPRSSDFGKVKVGNTRFDVTGGLASLVTLASRTMVITHGEEGWGLYSKSSTTGKITKLTSREYGKQTAYDVVTNFFTNKTSPMASVVVDLLRGQDFSGKKPTVTGEISNLLMPLPLSTYKETAADPNAANALLTFIADGLGLSASTYGSTKGTLSETFKTDVDPKVLNEIDRLNSSGYMPSLKSVETLSDVKEIKKQLSKEEYNSFLNDFGTSLQTNVAKRIQSRFYLNSSIDKKQSEINSIKEKTLKQTLYKYKYKKPEKTKVLEK